MNLLKSMHCCSVRIAAFVKNSNVWTGSSQIAYYMIEVMKRFAKKLIKGYWYRFITLLSHNLEASLKFSRLYLQLFMAPGMQPKLCWYTLGSLLTYEDNIKAINISWKLYYTFLVTSTYTMHSFVEGPNTDVTSPFDVEKINTEGIKNS